MQVSIFGPNLRDQSRGDIHVHAEGCADIARMACREPEYATGWSMEAASRVEVCDAVYPPEDFGCEPGEYLGELHFFPCCDGLPVRVTW
jgi:hypothetical protein